MHTRHEIGFSVVDYDLAERPWRLIRFRWREFVMLICEGEFTADLGAIPIITVIEIIAQCLGRYIFLAVVIVADSRAIRDFDP